MTTFFILAALGILLLAVSVYRTREMLAARVANVRGTLWHRSSEPVGYWFWVGLMTFFSLAGALFAAICLAVLAFHDFGA